MSAKAKARLKSKKARKAGKGAKHKDVRLRAKKLSAVPKKWRFRCSAPRTSCLEKLLAGSLEPYFSDGEED